MKTRTQIQEAIRAAFKKTYKPNFNFKTGFLEDINNGGFVLPCIWMCPLDLVSKTGRFEGTKTFAGTIYLLESAEGLTPTQKDDMWDAMEEAALLALSETYDLLDGVTNIEKIKGTTNEGAYSGYNDISLKINFELTMQYCANRG